MGSPESQNRKMRHDRAWIAKLLTLAEANAIVLAATIMVAISTVYSVKSPF